MINKFSTLIKLLTVKFLFNIHIIIQESVAEAAAEAVNGTAAKVDAVT